MLLSQTVSNIIYATFLVFRCFVTLLKLLIILSEVCNVKSLLTLDATNDMRLRRNNLFVGPMVDRRSAQETCLKTVIIFTILFGGTKTT